MGALVYVCVCEWLSRVHLFVIPWTVAGQLAMDFSRQEYLGSQVGCHFLLQGIFLTQGSNLGLLHCRQILYHLNHQGSLMGALRVFKWLIIITILYLWSQKITALMKDMLDAAEWAPHPHFTVTRWCWWGRRMDCRGWPWTTADASKQHP